MESKTEGEILRLLKEGLLPKQIAYRRKTSIQATYKCIRKLKRKGLLSGSSYNGYQPCIRIGVGRDNLRKIRLHRLEFNVKIHLKSDKYRIGDILEVDGNKVRLYTDSMEVYIHHAFIDNDGYLAYKSAVNYLFSLCKMVEDRLSVILIKNGELNYKRVKWHFAEMNNELAQECNKNKDYVTIRASEDGLIWASVDKSLDLDEFETMHKRTALTDMGEVVKPFFNDLRDNKPPLPSVQYNLLSGVIQAQQMFNDNLVKHMKVLDDMSATMKDIRVGLKKLAKSQ